MLGNKLFGYEVGELHATLFLVQQNLKKEFKKIFLIGYALQIKIYKKNTSLNHLNIFYSNLANIAFDLKKKCFSNKFN